MTGAGTAHRAWIEEVWAVDVDGLLVILDGGHYDGFAAECRRLAASHPRSATFG